MALKHAAPQCQCFSAVYAFSQAHNHILMACLTSAQQRASTCRPSFDLPVNKHFDFESHAGRQACGCVSALSSQPWTIWRTTCAQASAPGGACFPDGAGGLGLVLRRSALSLCMRLQGVEATPGQLCRQAGCVGLPAVRARVHGPGMLPLPARRSPALTHQASGACWLAAPAYAPAEHASNLDLHPQASALRHSRASKAPCLPGLVPSWQPCSPAAADTGAVRAENGQVAIFDATNTTEERRQLLVSPWLDCGSCALTRAQDWGLRVWRPSRPACQCIPCLPGPSRRVRMLLMGQNWAGGPSHS